MTSPPPGFLGVGGKRPSTKSFTDKGKHSRGETTTAHTTSAAPSTSATTLTATTASATAASTTTTPPSTTTASKLLSLINLHNSDDETEAHPATATTATAATTTLAPNTPEIEKAAGYIVSLLQSCLPSESSGLVLKNRLMPKLALRFSAHWHPSTPTKGSGYRCVRSEPGKPDPTVLACLVAELGSAAAGAAAASRVLPFAVWTDPGEVSVRLGERGHITLIYSANGNAAELTAANVASCATPPARRGRTAMPGLSPAARSFSPSSGSEDDAAGGRSPPASPQVAGRGPAAPPPSANYHFSSALQLAPPFTSLQANQRHHHSRPTGNSNTMGFGGYTGVAHHFQQQVQAQIRPQPAF